MSYQFMKRNKYHNKTCKCLSNHIHDSRKEGEYCDQLLAMKQNGLIKDYRSQISYTLAVNGKSICRHIVDFEVVNNDDTLEVREVKGFATDVWKLKHKLFEAVYPDINYVVIN